MPFAYVASSNAAATGATSVVCAVPAGVSVGDLLVAVYAFEGVAAGSGPWIVSNVGQLAAGFVGPNSGWMRAGWQAPSASGVGLEVWTAIYGIGVSFTAQFAAAQNCVVVGSAWSGEYNPTGTISGGPPKVAAVAQVTGNQPAAPSVTPNTGDLVVACGSDLMGGGGFGAPSGFTIATDNTRAGFGTAEAAIAYRVATVAGATGPIVFPNAAAAPTTRGGTATLVFSPAPVGAATGALQTAPMPPSLDLGAGWQVRVIAVDPTTGATVSGVTVTDFSLTCVSLTDSPVDGLAYGPWLLVPGQE